jgi:hypothetical protein
LVRLQLKRAKAVGGHGVLTPYAPLAKGGNANRHA